MRLHAAPAGGAVSLGFPLRVWSAFEHLGYCGAVGDCEGGVVGDGAAGGGRGEGVSGTAGTEGGAVGG